MEKSKYIAMLETADQYYNVSVMLQNEQAKWEGKDDYSFTVHTVVPRAVIATIACEIYLKALIYLQGNNNEPEHGHDLLALYNKLDKADRDWCEKEFNKSIGDKNSNLITELSEHNRVFVDIRYMYEIGWIHNRLNHVRVGSLTRFMKLLRSICQKYK